MSKTARCGLTLVIYMGVTRVGGIADALLAGGLPGTTPAAVVCSAHTAAQRQAVCTLATLVATVQQQGLGSPAILVVGDVVQASPMWAAQGQGIDAPLHAGCALPARRLVG
jgi:uroporphyrin-III C-methyltransferase